MNELTAQFFGTALGGIVGAGTGFLGAWWLEHKKQKETLKVEILAPLYDEIELVWDDVSQCRLICNRKEINLIREKHREYQIPAKLKPLVKEFYQEADNLFAATITINKRLVEEYYNKHFDKTVTAECPQIFEEISGELIRKGHGKKYMQLKAAFEGILKLHPSKLKEYEKFYKQMIGEIKEDPLVKDTRKKRSEFLKFGRDVANAFKKELEVKEMDFVDTEKGITLTDAGRIARL